MNTNREKSSGMNSNEYICRHCGGSIPDGGKFCPFCGRAVERKPSKKQRGNGQGCVIKLKSGKYKAIVTLGYYTDDTGKRHRKTRSQVFEKKKDALAAIPKLQAAPRADLKSVTFKALYDKWLPTHKVGKQTVNCYKAAFKYFEPIWFLKMSQIDIDDLQECLDECPHGRRTKENMKACAGLIYKFGIPRHAIPENLNLAQFLVVDGDAAAHRASFTPEQVKAIEAKKDTTPYADAVICMIYTGFRPSEFLALRAEDYDKSRQTLCGGAKTAAGRGRVVTISPKIQTIVAAFAASGGTLIKNPDGNAWALKSFTEDAFYPVVEAAGIDNPLVEIGGGKLRHKYTPHSCRHTFATLMKRVAGADKDKQELIGHASPEMLRYYQDAPLDDLRKITDAL